MKYICTSDIHFGHRKTPTEHIINSFIKCILTPVNSDTDVLFVGGDFFDRLLELNSIEVHQCIGFFNILLNYCTVNKIKLRVLEGTPGHDWLQCNILVKLNDIREVKCDLRYFKTLEIEYMSEYDKYILYLPDEWTKDHNDLENQINLKLAENNIKQVDIGMLHGAFKYQLQPHLKLFHFKEDYFLSVVKGFIHVGHYHMHTTFDRIIAQGSLERLFHGDEGDKGYSIIENDEHTFVVNPYSYTYKTIKITPSFTLDKLDKTISKLPVNSYIRLLIQPDHDFNLNFSKLKLRYLDYNIKKLVNEPASESISTTYILNEDIGEVDSIITNANIGNLVLTSILNNNTLTNKEIDKTKGYLTIFDNIKETNDESV